MISAFSFFAFSNKEMIAAPYPRFFL